MTPEIKVFLFAAALTGFAYVAVYTRMQTKTLGRIAVLDTGLTAVLLLAVGSVYYGSGIGFSLLLFTVPWWAFACLSMAIVEMPLAIWFCRKYGIDLGPPSG